MPTATTPVRLDAEITSAARKTAPRMSRSVAEQLSHWARLGRELERSPDVSLTLIQRTLDGQGDYDALPQKEQAVVRAMWAERLGTLRGQLRLDVNFAESGHRYAELDDKGRIVTRPKG